MPRSCMNARRCKHLADVEVMACQGLGGDDILIGGQRRGGLDGMEALCDHVCRAQAVGPEESRKGGAAGALAAFRGASGAERPRQ
jgi:hypothetical protein